MATIKDVVFDCSRPAPLARFWAAVLDDYDVRPYDEEEIAKLAAQGLTPDTDPVVFVDGPGPNICFQEVPEGKITKNRVHLELTAPDRHGEVERLVALGASVYYVGEEWTTLLDPEGNEFCVANP